MVITIQVGRYYRQRNGKVVGPIVDADNAERPWCLPHVKSWRKSGSYFTDGDQDESDLVEEVSVEEAFVATLNRSPEAIVDDYRDVFSARGRLNGDARPSGRMRMIESRFPARAGRIQQEWVDAFGRAVWLDVPLYEVDHMPPRSFGVDR